MSNLINDKEEKKLREEFSSLNYLLEKLLEIEGLEYRPIDDIPKDLGLELFYKSKKIAELFCDEADNKTIHGQYSVYSIVNNFEYKKLNRENCFDHFNNYINVT